LLPTELDRKIAKGELPSVAASDEALRNFMIATGISSKELAKLMLQDNKSELAQYMKETSSQVA
jgi:hypothetical protein